MKQRVDAVITWVDGSDPEWRKKRAMYSNSKHLDDTLTTSNVEGRFRDNGELRYLLRSLERFWPFEGNIYLVTDGQRPEFLNKHPRIKLIDHIDFIDSKYLPTFSSRAIEASLHKIPGLSEHFVSFNDDVILSRTVTFEDFFGAGTNRVYVTDEEIPQFSDESILSGQNDALNAHLWVNRNYGKSGLRNIIEHAPKAIRKSFMQKLENLHPEMFEEVRLEKFRQRSGQSILANIYPEWCVVTQGAEVFPSQSLYMLSDQIEQDDNALDEVKKALHYCLSVCINDTTDNRDNLYSWNKRYNALMSELFRNPSGYERKIEHMENASGFTF